MFNMLKGHKSKNPIQKHILKGFLRLSQCLLNVISAIRVHQQWHRKAPSATVPPPSAVQPYTTSPAMVSRHWLVPGHSSASTYTCYTSPFSPSAIRKTQRSLIDCNTWPKYRQGHNLSFSAGAIAYSACPFFHLLKVCSSRFRGRRSVMHPASHLWYKLCLVSSRVLH